MKLTNEEHLTVFTNLMTVLEKAGAINSTTSRNAISNMAGVYGKALIDSGYDYPPAQLREDYMVKIGRKS